MNSKGIIAIEDHNICMKCLNNMATHIYSLSGRGYGSRFDNERTHLQLCDDCHSDEYNTWFNEVGHYEDGDYWEEYTYEDNIIQYIEALPLESQELFKNSFSHERYFSDAQDWIDYQLDELSHDKCKEYGLYSPEERKAYRDRFPTCDKVYLKVYEDESSCCWCNRNAHGNKDGTCDDYNISAECYMCTKYKPRVGAMKVIDQLEEFYNDEVSRLNHMIKYATNRLKEMEELGSKGYMEKYE